MEKNEDFSEFQDEIEAMVHKLLGYYENANGKFPEDITFSEYGYKFVIETDVYTKHATIKTFLLTRDVKIHGQYNKTEIPAASIRAEITNEHGQVKYNFSQSGISIIPDEFINSHLKKHYKSVVDFIDFQEKK